MKVEVYGYSTCPYCIKAKEYLRDLGIDFKEINIESYDERQKFYDSLGLTSGRTVPQVFIDGKRIGGYDDLRSLNLKTGS